MVYLRKMMKLHQPKAQTRCIVMASMPEKLWHGYFINRAAGHVCHVDFATFIFTKGADPKTCGCQQPGLPGAAILLQAPNAAAAEVAVNVQAIQRGVGFAAINKSTGDGAVRG